ncbi:glycosyltransferase family 2 protein [Oceanomicrobium pacificus]|uniref:Glycosyltransferase n=1 Tax=Oceanomicrobium pacificus TaxID=2692916 RepID=A0A6B0U0K8_9RHOB|nr:glycosyltransferase family 2 protein [Oceanomicrobium pacificus]MXU66744.1 glycosyltransferase [Oceanomicrobium pacificus]
MTLDQTPDPSAGTQPPPEFSVVVPMKNEEGNVAFLVDAIAEACAGRPFETILVNDGSEDGTAGVIRALQADRPWLRLIEHARSGGQSAAVHSGVHAARAPVICTLDGDGQNPPAEIPKLVGPLLAKDAPATLGLVAGQRVARKDTASKRWASTFANGLRARMLHDDTRDTGCGLKAFRRDGFLELPFFNHMHRYLPALFSAYGWEVAHCDVSHAERHSGTSNYTNLHRALVGIHDLFGVRWLIKRAKPVRPLPEERP